MHHATTGNLDRRGAGDVTLLTLAEYRALPFVRRLAYRLYRHPLVMFGVGPAWLILSDHARPERQPLAPLARLAERSSARTSPLLASSLSWS